MSTLNSQTTHNLLIVILYEKDDGSGCIALQKVVGTIKHKTISGKMIIGCQLRCPLGSGHLRVAVESDVVEAAKVERLPSGFSDQGHVCELQIPFQHIVAHVIGHSAI